ncbi:MAG: hypothetical protein RL148_3154 [Planctomycetota bacterium]|jgi:chorismate mutase
MSTDELVRYRAAMDAINQRLCEVLQERARLCREIGRWKRAHGVPAADPAREQAMLEALLVHAGQGFDAAALERILRSVFHESRMLVDGRA